jgi:hypothetical protein
MVITENHIRKIVAEALSGLLLEFDIGVIGGSGPITEDEMQEPSQIFAKEKALANEIYQKNQENPKYKVNLEKVFGETEAYKVWKNYYTAMMSKPDKKAVNFMSWLHYVCDGKKGQRILAFSVDGSYLFGYWINGYFLACYFARIGFSGMAKVIKGICQYNNIIFAVTQDMSPMLTRLGVPKAEKTHDAPWRGKTVTKDVFGTSQEAIEMGFKILDYATGEQKPEQSTDDIVNDIKARYDALTPEQKKQLKGEIKQILQQKYPELLKKYKF